MRCPKCGAFMEDGKDVCLMCGTNVNTYVPDNNMNHTFGSGNSAFGSGNDFRNVDRGGFNKSNGSSRTDYKNASYAPVKKEDKDIFDKYQENKKLIHTLLFLGLVILITIIGFVYFKAKNKPIELKPVLQNLYFEVDDSLEAVQASGSGKLTFIKSGEKGNACSISIGYGSSTSEDHVYEYFKKSKDALEPERDKEGNVINDLDIYTPDEGNSVINNTTWYYMNIFYKTSLEGSATSLRYKYMTSMYKGYFYDIELVNNSNDATCNASLDNFAKTLKFLDN